MNVYWTSSTFHSCCEDQISLNIGKCFTNLCFLKLLFYTCPHERTVIWASLRCFLLWFLLSEQEHLWSEQNLSTEGSHCVETVDFPHQPLSLTCGLSQRSNPGLFILESPPPRTVAGTRCVLLEEWMKVMWIIFVSFNSFASRMWARPIGIPSYQPAPNMPSLILVALEWFESYPPTPRPQHEHYLFLCVLESALSSSTAERNQFESSAAVFVGIISPTEFTRSGHINTFQALRCWGQHSRSVPSVPAGTGSDTLPPHRVPSPGPSLAPFILCCFLGSLSEACLCGGERGTCWSDPKQRTCWL